VEASSKSGAQEKGAAAAKKRAQERGDMTKATAEKLAEKEAAAPEKKATALKTKAAAAAKKQADSEAAAAKKRAAKKFREEVEASWRLRPKGARFAWTQEKVGLANRAVTLQKIREQLAKGKLGTISFLGPIILNLNGTEAFHCKEAINRGVLMDHLKERVADADSRLRLVRGVLLEMMAYAARDGPESYWAESLRACTFGEYDDHKLRTDAARTRRQAGHP
jgi:hypothetical protein